LQFRDLAHVAAIHEFQLTQTSTSISADLVGSYSDGFKSLTLGDVQRLPNGNTLIIVSSSADIVELSPNDEVVQTIRGTTFGYANFRETLYGAPLR
jgi:hypothetical protein